MKIKVTRYIVAFQFGDTELYFNNHSFAYKGHTWLAFHKHSATLFETLSLAAINAQNLSKVYHCTCVAMPVEVAKETEYIKDHVDRTKQLTRRMAMKTITKFAFLIFESGKEKLE